MTVCPRCKTQFEGDHCPNCGTAATPQGLLFYCPRCGSVAAPDSYFCSKCGYTPLYYRRVPVVVQPTSVRTVPSEEPAPKQAEPQEAAPAKKTSKPISWFAVVLSLLVGAALLVCFFLTSVLSLPAQDARVFWSGLEILKAGYQGVSLTIYIPTVAVLAGACVLVLLAVVAAIMKAVKGRIPTVAVLVISLIVAIILTASGVALFVRILTSVYKLGLYTILTLALGVFLLVVDIILLACNAKLTRKK